MKAYYRSFLFEHNDGHTTAGFIYCDDDDSLIKIVPSHDSAINGSVKLDGQDLAGLIHLGLHILADQQLEEIATAINTVLKKGRPS